jgi:metal-responsive CopG/Arc/MetJ family transcriptional regulator
LQSRERVALKKQSKTTHTKRFAFRLSNDLLSKLNDTAEKQETSASEIIRKAIKKYINNT